jgi:predicted flavoprotein YhiN
LAKTALASLVPERLADILSERFGVAERRMGDLKDKDLHAFGDRLKSLSLTPTGDEGYAKAEVTAGGVDTAVLDQKTMQVRAVPGLYIVGEAVDVTGWLGGYNFQWAWSSGWAAGSAV